MATIIPVILSGGSGTRLWPLSTTSKPKQFHALDGELSLFQETLDRLPADVDTKNLLVVANTRQRFLIAQQCAESLGFVPTIVLEPEGRNTAPAAVVAALFAQSIDPDAMILILPADHLIRDVSAYHEVLEIAQKEAEEGRPVTFGIVPTAPETGYGYIEKGALSAVTGAAFDLKAFKEKPDADTAQIYVDSKNFYWNSGMFLFPATRFLDDMKRFAPKIHEAAAASWQLAAREHDFVWLDEDRFHACPADSIDYAVMEHVSDGIVVPADIGWSDVGAWNALWEALEKSEEGNVHTGHVHAVDAERTMIHAAGRFVAAIGVKDLVIVETDHAVLVIDQSRSQDVKDIVNHLKNADLHHLLEGPDADE